MFVVIVTSYTSKFCVVTPISDNYFAGASFYTFGWKEWKPGVRMDAHSIMGSFKGARTFCCQLRAPTNNPIPERGPGFQLF